MINNLAVVQTKDLGRDVTIGEFSIVRDGVHLGDGVVIHPHVIISPGVNIDDGVEVFPGAYIGKEPKTTGALARTPEFARRIDIGKNSSIGSGATLYYDVEVGHNTLIGDGASIRERARIANRCVVGRQVMINYNVTIGSGSKVMDLSWLAGNMVIQEDVFISGNVLTANDNSLGGEGYDEDRILGPTIERGAAVGVGAILLPGITIGERAIVAAGALVTKDVEPHTLVMGAPARPVRKLRGPNGRP